MATREVTILTDDLDGTDGAETVTISINGATYELELGPRNKARLDKALSPYLEAARKVRKPRGNRAA